MARKRVPISVRRSVHPHRPRPSQPVLPPGQPDQTGFTILMFGDAFPVVDRTCTKWPPGSHWNTKWAALTFSPLGWPETYWFHRTGPWTVLSGVRLACRKLMIFALLRPTLLTASART